MSVYFYQICFGLTELTRHLEDTQGIGGMWHSTAENTLLHAGLHGL